MSPKARRFLYRFSLILDQERTWSHASQLPPITTVVDLTIKESGGSKQELHVLATMLTRFVDIHTLRIFLRYPPKDADISMLRPFNSMLRESFFPDWRDDIT